MEGQHYTICFDVHFSGRSHMPHQCYRGKHTQNIPPTSNQGKPHLPLGATKRNVTSKFRGAQGYRNDAWLRLHSVLFAQWGVASRRSKCPLWVE